ncbi:MAG: type II toxin-antitoxin system RelE/ParE family toxin [Fibrobacteria bacterium]|nr:type II toxin-antitoxin system RelE/ParE family toxin [Fibrobacteria bacterium]
MKILFKTKKLERTLSQQKEMNKAFDKRMVKKLRVNMSLLRASECLDDIPRTPPQRCHELTGRLKGKFAIDLKQPYRLIFTPANIPVPKKSDGGIDLKQVTAVKILEVIDYH